jgi:hypothetical protein
LNRYSTAANLLERSLRGFRAQFLGVQGRFKALDRGLQRLDATPDLGTSVISIVMASGARGIRCD